MTKLNKNIIWIFFALIIISTIYLTINGFESNEVDYVSIGNLIILALTLLVLLQYAYDTNRLANITQDYNLTPNIMHKLSSALLSSDEYDIGFDLLNQSSFYVKAFVNIELKCYNDNINIPNDVYCGKRPWILPPNAFVHGHFRLNDNLLKSSNRTIAELKQKGEDINTLSMKVNINCTSI
ncbi:MAG: hypothetical protein EPN88_13130 [Bacteroidetes bacterium]|nr:MAG: hypothetical protein EPN88_13130 [Bacteroidota bacterium]